MFWYFFLLILIVFGLYIGRGTICKKNIIILFYIVPLFICFGYMTGADWRMYEREFYDISYKIESKEPSYYLLAQSFKTIGVGFWEFSILYKLIGYYAFLFVFKKFSQNYLWGLIYWFPNYALFLWVDHPARNFIAIIIFSFSLQYIEKGKFLPFLLITSVASSFHATCLSMIPIYFVVRYTPNCKYSIWLLSTVLVYVLAELVREYMAPALEMLNLMERMQGYMIGEEYNAKMSIIRFLIFFFFLFLAVINIDKIRRESIHADFMLKLSFLYLFYFCVGNINIIFFRFQYFLIVPICVLVSYLWTFMRRGPIRLAFQTFIILFAFAYTYNLITRTSHYIPYSNYLEYIFQEKPSYNYRFDYNLKYSPYKDGDEDYI